MNTTPDNTVTVELPATTITKYGWPEWTVIDNNIDQTSVFIRHDGAATIAGSTAFRNPDDTEAMGLALIAAARYQRSQQP